MLTQAYRKFTDMSKEQILARMKDDLSGGAQQSYYLTVNRDKRYCTHTPPSTAGRFALAYHPQHRLTTCVLPAADTRAASACTT